VTLCIDACGEAELPLNEAHFHYNNSSAGLLS